MRCVLHNIYEKSLRTAIFEDICERLSLRVFAFYVVFLLEQITKQATEEVKKQQQKQIQQQQKYHFKLQLDKKYQTFS